MVKIRKPAWAGRFYPGRPTELREMVNSFLDALPAPDQDRRLLGLVVPHAGYIYSGSTAAAGYKLAAAKAVDTVVVIAPSHGQFIRGVSLYNGDAYATPLGEISVDRELTARVAAFSPLLHLADEGHSISDGRPEHSLEVQLPFLQLALKSEFKLVAAVFHDYDWEVCSALGEALASVYREGMLIVASSDLYHGESYDGCGRADAQTIAALLNGDAEAFCRGHMTDQVQACGAGPVAALLHAGAKLGATAIRLLAQTNSADVTGEHGDYIVGYAAAAVEWPPA